MDDHSSRAAALSSSRAVRSASASKTNRVFEISYATSRLARIDAGDRETAKRRFAAYALYDDATYVRSDVETGFGDDAVLAPFESPPPTAGTRDEMRAWLARRTAESDAFEPALFEPPDRALDAYLRLLATNDPWRLEGHGSLGRVLSGVAVRAELTTFDLRVRYGFEATQFVDYLRADTVFAIDPARPEESLRIEHVVDVSALRDESLRQIASSYDVVAREYALTQRFAQGSATERPYRVTFDLDSWQRYVTHRRAEPDRFLPPPGWTSAFETYGEP